MKRDEFGPTIKATLAKRAGSLCSICGMLTTGPSDESADAVLNIGVAAHITAAASRGPRFDESLTKKERSDITNGIWLCQNHAKLIDDDWMQWSASRLRDTKRYHEEYVRKSIENLVRLKEQSPNFHNDTVKFTPRGFAFVHVSQLTNLYRKFIKPILVDRRLNKGKELGILMCTSRGKTFWTILANSEWLRWVLKGRDYGFMPSEKTPQEQIHGIVPAWPFFLSEFLSVLVETKSIFGWQRSPGGYLYLSQLSVNAKGTEHIDSALKGVNRDAANRFP